MAITFDGSTKRIILDSASVSAEQIWSAWVTWLNDDPLNWKWPVAFNQVGGDDLGSGLYIPIYLFLKNGWRVRPMESNHLLVVTGNLFVDGGGQPVVQTLGSYNVSVQYTVPVQAQAYDSGGGGGATASEMWAHNIDGSYTAGMIMKLLGAVMGGLTTVVDNGDGTASVTFRNLSDTTDAATFDMIGSDRVDRMDDL